MDLLKYFSDHMPVIGIIGNTLQGLCEFRLAIFWPINNLIKETSAIPHYT
jgi:hypothetical protein